MSETDKLVNRLEASRPEADGRVLVNCIVLAEAASTIRAQQRELSRLRSLLAIKDEALDPFADEGVVNFYREMGENGTIVAGRDWCITLGDLRRAREARDKG